MNEKELHLAVVRELRRDNSLCTEDAARAAGRTLGYLLRIGVIRFDGDGELVARPGLEPGNPPL